MPLVFNVKLKAFQRSAMPYVYPNLPLPFEDRVAINHVAEQIFGSGKRFIIGLGIAKYQFTALKAADFEQTLDLRRVFPNGYDDANTARLKLFCNVENVAGKILPAAGLEKGKIIIDGQLQALIIVPSAKSLFF